MVRNLLDLHWQYCLLLMNMMMYILLLLLLDRMPFWHLLVNQWMLIWSLLIRKP